MKRLISLAAAATLSAGLLGAGCGGDDTEPIPVITGPTGATGFSSDAGLEDEKDKGKKNN